MRSVGLEQRTSVADIQIQRDETALLLVDLQPDFMPGGALPVEGGDRILAPIRALMARDLFGLYAATQDWHPPGHASFASAHAGCKPFDVIELHGTPQTLWPDHCLQGSTARLCILRSRGTRLALSYARAWSPMWTRTAAFATTGTATQSGRAPDLPATCASVASLRCSSAIWRAMFASNGPPRKRWPQDSKQRCFGI